MTVNGPMTRSDRVATLEEAKAQFQKSWDAWKAWSRLEEVPLTCAAAHAGGRGGRERKTPLQVGPARGFQRAVRLRLGTSWTPNRASEAKMTRRKEKWCVPGYQASQRGRFSSSVALTPQLVQFSSVQFSSVQRRDCLSPFGLCAG